MGFAFSLKSCFSCLFFVCFYSNSGNNYVDATVMDSSTSLLNFLQLNFSTGIQKFIEHETFRSKLLVSNSFQNSTKDTEIIKKRVTRLKSIYNELVKNETSALRKTAYDLHPTSVFAYLRNFWCFYREVTNETLFGKNLKPFLNLRKLKDEIEDIDLEVIATALHYIQISYNLSIDEVSKGRIQGHKGEPLTGNDLIEVGYAALKTRVLSSAQDWLEKCIEDIDLSNLNKSSQTDGKALFELGKIYYQRGKKDKGLEFIEKAVDIDPDDPIYYKNFIKYRSGVQVRKIKELDREKVEHWRRQFFDVCLNASKPVTKEGIESVLKKKLMCRYRASQYLPYLRWREEVLSIAPFISRIYSFVKDEPLQDLKSEALPRLSSAKLPGHLGLYTWQAQSAVVWDKDVSANGSSSSLQKLTKHITDISRRDIDKTKKVSIVEPYHVIDFGIGGTYLPHQEIEMEFPRKYLELYNGRRWTTMMIFLRNVPKGGYAVFPYQNVAATPVKGDALLWENVRPNGLTWTDPIYVGVCPNSYGQNIVALKGMWNLYGASRRICGPKVGSTYLAVEKALACKAGRRCEVAASAGPEKKKTKPRKN